MSLISQYEILPQDEHRLNDYLLKQLQSKAKDIKTMTYDEQYKFYQTYFAKKEKGNSHISKDILISLLSETSYDSKHKRNDYIDIITKDNTINLYRYNSNERHIDKITIDIKDKDEIEFVDMNENNLSIDLDIVDMKINRVSDYTDDESVQDSIIISDTYSLYDVNTSTLTTSKKVTMSEIPIVNISDIEIDDLLVVQSGNNKNYVSLVSTSSYCVKAKKVLNSSRNPLTKATFLANSELVLLYNKSELAINDFRTFKKNSDISILFANESMNIDIAKYIDEFNFITASPSKICLFDLRYPTLPLSEEYMNINYTSLRYKQIYSNEITQSFILYDESMKDMSHMKVKLLDTITQSKPISNFLSFELIKNDKTEIEIQDTVSYILSKDEEESKANMYLNFIVDNFGGIYLNTYQLDKKYTPMMIANMSEDLNKNVHENDIKRKRVDDDIIEMYRKCITNSIYEGNKSKIDFGTVVINGEEKKMFDIESKRDLVEEMINNDKDIEMDTNSNSIVSTDKENKLTNEDIEKIKFLIDDLNLNIDNK